VCRVDFSAPFPRNVEERQVKEDGFFGKER
jgi:hypothetical protein